MKELMIITKGKAIKQGQTLANLMFAYNPNFAEGELQESVQYLTKDEQDTIFLTWNKLQNERK